MDYGEIEVQSTEILFFLEIYIITSDMRTNSISTFQNYTAFKMVL